MPKTRPAYPEEFRREAVQMLRAGRSPRELAEALGCSEQTLRNWRRQDQRDRHERDDGPTTGELESSTIVGRRLGVAKSGAGHRPARQPSPEDVPEVRLTEQPQLIAEEQSRAAVAASLLGRPASACFGP